MLARATKNHLKVIFPFLAALGPLYVTWLHLWGFIRTYLYFCLTGKNHRLAFHYLVLNYCRTGGRFNEQLNRWLCALIGKRDFSGGSSFLPALTEQEFSQLAKSVKRDGWAVYPHLLPAEICDQLNHFMRGQLVRPNPIVGNVPDALLFSKRNEYTLASRYCVPESALLEAPVIQSLISDEWMLKISQEYLGCCPSIDMLNLWWSEPGDGSPNQMAAQAYHFDMDRIKFLKFFIYLTDVTAESGPHCVISKSHNVGSKPNALLRQGYARISDEELAMYYPAESFQELTGPAGTILIVTTSVFHKGKPPTRNGRLMLEIELCDSLYGAPYESPQLKPQANSNLSRVLKVAPRVYARYRTAMTKCVTPTVMF